MITITFDIISILKFKLDIIKYEKISSTVKWVQKGIDLTAKHFPRIINYLSKQSILANICKYKIVIESDKNKKRSESMIKKVFAVWIRKERAKRMTFVVFESILLPFTPFLALLPGPNVFFYVPALLLYYHWKSLKGLKKLDLENLQLEIHHVDKSEIGDGK
ncbi:MAG: hypothetical protein ABFR36_09470 [Acidobacteriota bacterium]